MMDFSEQLKELMSEVRREDVEGEDNNSRRNKPANSSSSKILRTSGGGREKDWANLHLLHHTSKMLEQSGRQCQSLKQSLSEKDDEINKLRTMLREKEDKERSLIKEKEELELVRRNKEEEEEVKMSSAPCSRTEEVGVQVNLGGRPSSRRHFEGAVVPFRGLLDDEGLEWDQEEEEEEEEEDQGENREKRRMMSIAFDEYDSSRRGTDMLWPLKGGGGDQASSSLRSFNVDRSSFPKVRPVMQDGEVVGYTWRHYQDHEYLNPRLDYGGDEVEEEEEEHGDNVEENEKSGSDEGDGDKDEEIEESEGEEETDEIEIDLEAEGVDKENKSEDGDIEILKIIKQVPKKKSGENKDEASSTSPLQKKKLPPENEERDIEVPKWRVVEYIPLDREAVPGQGGIVEGFSALDEEDISEAAILRRHARLEQDEKRRKRWDSQRMREETYLERLKRRMQEREQMKEMRRKERAARRPGRPPASSYAVSEPLDNGEDSGKDQDPSSDEPVIRFVRVREEVPMFAFGHVIPDFPEPEWFELPWEANDCTPPDSPDVDDKLSLPNLETGDVLAISSNEDGESTPPPLDPANTDCSITTDTQAIPSDQVVNSDTNTDKSEARLSKNVT